jgi:hypothetical protein
MEGRTTTEETATKGTKGRIRTATTGRARKAKATRTTEVTTATGIKVARTSMVTESRTGQACSAVAAHETNRV